MNFLADCVGSRVDSRPGWPIVIVLPMLGAGVLFVSIARLLDATVGNPKDPEERKKEDFPNKLWWIRGLVIAMKLIGGECFIFFFFCLFFFLFL